MITYDPVRNQSVGFFGNPALFAAFMLSFCFSFEVILRGEFFSREFAPQAGAGPSFLGEKKGSKDSPKGRVSILSPLEFPPNDQRRCLWKPREAPALVLFHTQARPACEASA